MWRGKADRSQRTANAVGILLASPRSGARSSGARHAQGCGGSPAPGWANSRGARHTDGPQPRGPHGAGCLTRASPRPNSARLLRSPFPSASPAAEPHRRAPGIPSGRGWRPGRSAPQGAAGAPGAGGEGGRPALPAVPGPARSPGPRRPPGTARSRAPRGADGRQLSLGRPLPPRGAAASHGRGAAPALTMPGGGPASLRRTSPAAPRLRARPASPGPPPRSAPRRPRTPTCPRARPRCARLGARLALPLAPEGGQPLETAYLRFPAAAVIYLFILLFFPLPPPPFSALPCPCPTPRHDPLPPAPAAASQTSPFPPIRLSSFHCVTRIYVLNTQLTDPKWILPKC